MCTNICTVRSSGSTLISSFHRDGSNANNVVNEELRENLSERERRRAERERRYRIERAAQSRGAELEHPREAVGELP